MKREKCFVRSIIIGSLLNVVLFSGTCLSSTTLGQSCALTGPTSFLGKEMHKDAAAYFLKYAKGISLSVKDDGYESKRCIEITTSFLKEGVDALFGYVGTSTSKVAVPLATQHNTIFFGAFTGASFLSDVRTNPYSFSVRGSYNAEIENMMRRLHDDLGITKIGIFVQRDAFGLAGVRGAVRADKILDGIEIYPPVPDIPQSDAPVEEWNTFWKSVPNYHRKTVMVGQGVRAIKGSGVQAVILVGAYRPCAAAINKWHKVGFKGPMINISFVGSVGMAKRLKSMDNVYISQVVPDPWDASIPIVREYQNDIKDQQYGFVSLEGYLAAKIFHHAVGKIKGSVNSDSIKQALESMSQYDAGGIEVSFAPDDHRAMDSVYLTTMSKSGDSIAFEYVDKLKSLK